MSDSEQEAAWVDRIRQARAAGDPEPFGEVVRRYGERIHALVYGLVGNESEADDVCQEAFMRAYQALDRFQGNASLYTWIYRVAVNCAHDHRKRSQRRKNLIRASLSTGGSQVAGSDGLDSGGGIDVASDAPAPSRVVEGAEVARRVREAIAEVPHPFREVLVMRELEGLSYEEIAALLDLKLGTVESRLFRGRKLLRAIAERRGLADLL